MSLPTTLLQVKPTQGQYLRGLTAYPLALSGRAILTIFLLLGKALHAQAPAPPLIQAELDRLSSSLTNAAAANDRGTQAAALKDIGYIQLDDLRQTAQAAKTFDRALPLARAAADAHDEALILLGDAVIDYRNNLYPRGIETARQQLVSARNDPEVEARAQIVLGFGLNHENQPQPAIGAAAAAQIAANKISDPGARLRTLLKLIDLHRTLADDGHPQLSAMRAVATEADDLARQRRNSTAEAHALDGLAKTHFLDGNPRLALAEYTQALDLLTAQHDEYATRSLLLDRASTYRELNDIPSALADLDRRIALLERTGDTKAALQTRLFSTDLLADLGRFDEALTIASKGLEQAREAQLPDLEAYANNLTASLYLALDQGPKALEAASRALTIRRRIGPKNREADALRLIGNIQRDLLDNPRQAGAAFTQALAIYASQHDLPYQTAVLISLCRVYGLPAGPQPPLDSQKALSYCSHALSIARTGGNTAAEKEALLNTGEVHSALGGHARALDFYSHALPLVAAGNKPEEQSQLFFDLTREYRQSRPDLAIFYGKQSINLLQQLRVNLRGQDETLQSTYLRSHQDRYRTLAAILIAQGRLPEAQQVLDLLKQHEFSQYTRAAALDPTAAIELTPSEEEAAADYRRTSQTLIAESKQFARLKKLPTRTPSEEADYERLAASLASGSKGLNDFYDRLYTLFGRNAQANKQLADVKGTAAIVKQQLSRSPGAVALWTLVTPNRLSILVITPTAMVAREVPIAEADLNARVQDLRHALQDPAGDPHPAAQQLYDLLVAPIQADLDQAQAKTLIWSLDGVLRYIPMAALYDGHKYFVERYNSVNFTPTAASYLADKPAVDSIHAVAMGVSMQLDKSLAPLPAVATELHQIVRDPTSPSGGTLPGAILLDSSFTEKNMEANLNGQRQIVHIASHFVSRPGDDRRSYLLLAGKDMLDPNGYHLTVADFRDNQNISLENTDLLTLSACDTGIDRSTSDGREVEGLSATAQAKGAKAVLSSLWKVNDASTGLFMADFYKRWVEAHGALTKVEALRQAQLDLLQNPQTPFTHPYFWAPFVLVGNWR